MKTYQSFFKPLYFCGFQLSNGFSLNHNTDESIVKFENNKFNYTGYLYVDNLISCNDAQAYFLTTLLKYYDNLDTFFSQLTLDNKCAIDVSNWTIAEIEDIKSYFYFFKEVINDVLFIGSSEESVKELKYVPISFNYRDLRTFLDLENLKI